MSNEKSLNDGNAVLIPRASEMYAKAERGIPGASGFLTPKEAYILSKTFKTAEEGGLMLLWGGCFDSERKTAFFLPEYYFPPNFSEKSEIVPYVLESASDFISEKINALKIKGSGYMDLSHRDYLGGILSLGIERDCIGDIYITSPHESVIMVSSKIAPYLLVSLKKIGGDTLKSVENIKAVDKNFDTGRKFLSITVSAASLRLDCAVRALSNKGSREDAVNLIRGGSVELNYTAEYKAEKHISPGDTLSIRGIGKFIIDSAGGETKRGRIKITAKKYM